MVVSCPKGDVGCILNYGKLPYFDPMHYSDFRTSFRVRDKGNLAMCPSCKL